MKSNLDKIALELYKKLQTRFNNVKIANEYAEVLSKKEDIPQARFFEFEYIENSRPYGTVAMSLDEDDGLIIQISGDLTSNKSAASKFFDFIRSFRQFAKRRLMKFNIRNIGKRNLDQRDYTFQSKRKEYAPMPPIMENKLYGSNKISYQDLGEARLIIKHSQPINTDYAAGRSQHIQNIYIENIEGERFKYPFKHLNGARALAEHIKHGGNPYDAIGRHITGLSEELAHLRKFKNYVGRQDQISEAMGSVSDRVIERIENIKKQVNQLQRSAYYEEFAESFVEREQRIIPEELVNDWVDRLTIRTFNEELKGVFPYLYELIDENELPVKEIDLDNLVDEGLDSSTLPRLPQGKRYSWADYTADDKKNIKELYTLIDNLWKDTGFKFDMHLRYNRGAVESHIYDQMKVRANTKNEVLRIMYLMVKNDDVIKILDQMPITGHEGSLLFGYDLGNVDQNYYVPISKIESDKFVYNTFIKGGYASKTAPPIVWLNKKVGVAVWSKRPEWADGIGEVIDSSDNDTTQQSENIESVFESFMEALAQGNTGIFSQDPMVKREAIDKLNDLLSRELLAGPDGVNARDSLRGIIDDPVFLESLRDMDNLDVRALIKDYIKQQDPDLIYELKFSEPSETSPEAEIPALKPMPAEPPAPTGELPPEQMPGAELGGEMPGGELEEPGAELPPEQMPPGQQPPAPMAERLEFGKRHTSKSRFRPGFTFRNHRRFGLKRILKKAQKAGATLETVLNIGDSNYTIEDIINECGFSFEECGFESPKSGIEEVLDSIIGFWNSEAGNFTKGGEGVKTIVIKKAKDGEFKHASDEDIEYVLNLIDKRDPSSNQHNQISRIKDLAGIRDDQPFLNKFVSDREQEIGEVINAMRESAVNDIKKIITQLNLGK